MTTQAATASLPLGRRGARPGDDLAPDKIHHRGEHHQADEPRLPPAVEDVAGHRDPQVPPAVREVEIDQQKHRQEVEDEDVGGEDHAGSASRSSGSPRGRRTGWWRREAVVQRPAGRQVLQLVVQRQAVDFTRHKRSSLPPSGLSPQSESLISRARQPGLVVAHKDLVTRP